MASKDADDKCSNSKTEETIALEKKRSKSRRVSFAETTAIHLFIRDEDCETPPAAEESSARMQRSDSDEIRELLVSDSDSDDDKDRVSLEPSFLRPLESPSPGSFFGSATSNDAEENFFGPVSADFIRPGRLSDSGVSEDNHDVTMDSTAFSMHFRSLARSESGGEFKTPTGARLAFGERTFGQISTSGGDSMVLTASNKRVSDSVLAETVNGSGNSDDMSVVGEHSRIYDYGELPPELDILLAEDGKDKGASHTSQFERSNPILHDKVDAGSFLNPSGVELLSSNNREIDAQLDLNVEKASDGAISTIQVIFDQGNDGISVNLSKDRTNSPNVMPVGENDHERQDAVEPSGNFQSPMSTSHSRLNHNQRIAGSVSSVLEKRRQIFRVLPIDESNLILSEKKIHEGSKDVSASTLEKSVSRVKRHTFPFTSASKAESNASRLWTSDSVTRSLIRNNSLRTNSKDLLIEHMAAPVACLDEQFLNVARDDGKFESMGKTSKSNMKTLADLQNANYTEANDVEMSSLSVTVGSHDDFAKSSVSRFPLALSTEKQFDPSVSRVTHTKEIASFTGSDGSLLDISSNGLKHNLDSVKSGDSTFSPMTNVGRMVSASPLYQERLSKNPNHQVGSNLSLSRDVKQMVIDDLGSRSKINSLLVTESKNEAERSSSAFKHFQTVSHGMQNDESTPRNFNGFHETFTSSEHALIDKALDQGELVINKANIGTGTMSTRAFPVEDMKPVTGDINPMKLPIQVSESSKGELSYSLIQKKPCLTDDTVVHPSSGNRVLTPRSYPFSSVHDENDQPVSESSKIYDADRPSSLKRKLFDKAKYDNAEITEFQHKVKFSKDQKQGNVKEAHYIGSDSTRDWVDVFTSFLGMTKLSHALINKLDLTQIRMLDEMLVHLDKMRSYELLYRDICSQEAFKIANYQQTKRLADMKLLLYRTLYQKAKVQLMHLERDKLLDQLRQLDSRVEESNMLISSCHGSRINSQKDIEIDSFLPESSLVAAEIPSLRKELEVSEKSIRNLHDSFHTYIKDMKELNCTETTVCIKNLLHKRVACRSLRSELQLCQVGSIKAVDGKHNILFDHGCIMSQRFMVKSVSTNGLYISNTLDDVKISMMSIGDVYTAFSFVLRSETNLAYSGLEVIAQEVQKTTSLLHTLLDVVEEVCLAMIELKNLTGSKFLQPSAGKLNLQLSFTDFNSGARVVLSVDVTCLKWGLYPSQVLPYDVQGSPAARHESLRFLLDSINSAIHGVRFGYMRILNLCRCVSRTIQANCTN